MPLTSRIIGRIKVRSKRSYFDRNILLPYKNYIPVQETAGLPLLLFCIIAMVWANVEFLPDYEKVWTTNITFRFGDLNKTETIRKWINDFLLPVFFFVVGMEIKREIIHGTLSTFKRAAMPVAAAAGGMVMPAFIYMLFNLQSHQFNGWAVPVATDVAFTLSLLSLLRRRIPSELIIFTLAFTVADDIGGTIIIAFFYTHHFILIGLIVAVVFLGLISMAKIIGIVSDFIYLMLGLGFFVSIFFSGIHTNIAAVALGLLVPAHPCFKPEEFQQDASKLFQRLRALTQPDAIKQFDSESESPPQEQLEEERDLVLGQMEALVAGTQSTVDRLSRKVYPWISYLVLPIFALANSGITISRDLLSHSFTNTTTLGVFFGLALGKPLGITLAVWMATKTGIASLPKDIQFNHVVGLSIVSGIGFTISLFIAHLSFGSDVAIQQSKIAIFTASILAAGIGFFYLFINGRKNVREETI